MSESKKEFAGIRENLLEEKSNKYGEILIAKLTSRNNVTPQNLTLTLFIENLKKKKPMSDQETLVRLKAFNEKCETSEDRTKRDAAIIVRDEYAEIIFDDLFEKKMAEVRKKKLDSYVVPEEDAVSSNRLMKSLDDLQDIWEKLMDRNIHKNFMHVLLWSPEDRRNPAKRSCAIEAFLEMSGHNKAVQELGLDKISKSLLDLAQYGKLDESEIFSTAQPGDFQSEPKDKLQAASSRFIGGTQPTESSSSSSTEPQKKPASNDAVSKRKFE